MDVSEVRVTLVGDGGQEGLLAYCTVSFDRVFVVHDIKLVRLGDRHLVSMPSRKITAHCPQCREQNHIRAEYCNRCGEKLDRPKIPRISPGLESRLDKDRPRDAVYHIDVAHPISREFRTNIERLVVEEYRRERERVAPPRQQLLRPVPIGA